MHRCLDIPEIVALVCSQLQPNRTPDSTFHNPALDVLWNNQDTILNLLRCMPRDVFSLTIVDTPREGSREARLLRPIVAADWERPLWYSRRVRILYYEPLSARRVLFTSNIFPALSMALPDDFLPNLVGLHWHNHTEAEFPHVALFLGPKILHLSLTCPLALHLSILSKLPKRCPALKHLVTHGPALPPNVCAAFHCLPRLESLSMPALEVATLECIGRLDGLKALNLSSLPPSFSPTGIHGPLFSHLTDICLANVLIGSATQFFKMCVDTSIVSIYIGFHPPGTAAEISRLCSSLAACRRSHASMLSFKLTPVHAVTPVERMSYVINPATLRILFCFQYLVQIEIWSFAFELDDAMVLEMARAWPELENLKLRAPPVLNPGITLRGLQFLAQHCPYLYSLDMTLDASAVPTSLFSLNVAASPIHDPVPVARFISGIFPRLETISTLCSSYNDDEDEQEDEQEVHRRSVFSRRWEEVQSLMLEGESEGTDSD
ncbi:hypothetical protein DFH06DRAFT_1197805 [Mycena polygramma]|nr:hypothetical protein DFH06DRAFT_1197805 [Mycena polygramma]